MSSGFQLGRAALRARARSRPIAGTRPLATGPGALPAALRVLLRLLVCQLLPAGWLLLSAASAAAQPLAAAASEPAPMCDNDAASIVALDDIPEIDRGRFEALPCEAQLLLAGWQPDAPELGRKAARCDDAEPPTPAHHVAAPRPRPEGASQLGTRLPARSEPAPAKLGAQAGLAASLGHARTPFRPPLARG
jgi:hypothetical protein